MYDILSLFSVFVSTLINDYCASVFSRGLWIACDEGTMLNMSRWMSEGGSSFFYPLGDCLLGAF